MQDNVKHGKFHAVMLGLFVPWELLDDVVEEAGEYSNFQTLLDTAMGSGFLSARTISHIKNFELMVHASEDAAIDRRLRAELEEDEVNGRVDKQEITDAALETLTVTNNERPEIVVAQALGKIQHDKVGDSIKGACNDMVQKILSGSKLSTNGGNDNEAYSNE
ncbi:hypothetical protein K440DRAFT_422234 [Wilcoxina mikolae CBS 423.85]|nr:hypothetical protein K440DRAFT_422234 [Wilcoxina mikolae CBS 423.85]